eukprot:9752794-Heterocapsa_arctica.AAC.1
MDSSATITVWYGPSRSSNYVGTTSNEMLPLRTLNKSRYETLATLRWNMCRVTVLAGPGMAPVVVV